MFKFKPGWDVGRVMGLVEKYNPNVVVQDENGCVYQDSFGSRCVIGALIPDGHPSLDSEQNTGVDVVLKKFPELMDFMPFEDVEALDRMQAVHDCSMHGKVYEDIHQFLLLNCKAA